MKRTFEVITEKSKVVTLNGKRSMIKDSLRLEVEVLIEGRLINLGYGYKSWFTDHKEGFDSVLPGHKYRLHNSIMPKEGDVWKYGNRTFTVGKKSGFVVYTAPLLENGVEVARIKFEDYYKD